MDQLSVLKLFKGFIGEKTDQIRAEGLQYGLLIPASASAEVYADAVRLYGKDAKAWNQTFHKSWDKVATAPIEELIYEQLLHYLTTYGFEELGIFSHDSVYVPHEKLEIPQLQEDVELISIHAFSKAEVTEKLMSLLTGGIALSKDTIACISDLAELIDISRFAQITNREARIALCDALTMTPDDPDEFLRYVIYKACGSTLKIQDPETIAHLKLYSRRELWELFQRYLKDDEAAGMKRLASVFFRNRKLFLAMKTSEKDLEAPAFLLQRHFRKNEDESEYISRINHLINRLRKLADEYHQPLPVNRLDSLTSPSTQISDDQLIKALDSITVFREIRILNGLSYALNNDPAIVYKIRNGKSFATQRKVLHQDDQQLIRKRHELVRKHLIDRLKPNLTGKTALLNKDFIYKAPTSEKQFVSNFPCGSSLKVKRDSAVIFGIHWTNLETENSDRENGRVDLDLHMQNLEVSFGWNAAYRDDESEILFSGDMTDAPLPLGASELYYIGPQAASTFMFTINKYTDNPQKIPFEIVLARAAEGISQEQMEDNYMVDPNDIILKIPMEMPVSESMMRLGMVCVSDDAFRIVFDSFSSRRMIVSQNDDPVFRDTFAYLNASGETSLSLVDLLQECGAQIIEVPICENEMVSMTADYDLRINHLSKETIISLL